MDNWIFDLQRHSQGAVTPILTRGCPRSNRVDPPVRPAHARRRRNAGAPGPRGARMGTGRPPGARGPSPPPPPRRLAHSPRPDPRARPVELPSTPRRGRALTPEARAPRLHLLVAAPSQSRAAAALPRPLRPTKCKRASRRLPPRRTQRLARRAGDVRPSHPGRASRFRYFFCGALSFSALALASSSAFSRASSASSSSTCWRIFSGRGKMAQWPRT